MTAIYDTATFDHRNAIGGLIGRVRLNLFEALDAELAPYDITAAQYMILVNLASGIDSAAGLCKGVSYDPGAMTRMIDRLERKGFVRRVRCPDDRRVVKLALTDEGRAVYPKLLACAAEVTNRKLKGFTKTEAQHLEVFLQRLLNNG
jgi:DNA-binding MarR family transcriptional regulator